MIAASVGGTARRAGRRALLASTALSAALLAAPAVRAAPAPQTTPQGGQVVGGSASISQGQGNETITQKSQRAAINWQSFNLGKDAHVNIHQPNARAILLNRVISNDPSVIAGRIDANGQLILVNRSGVVFTRTAQVNAESLVVSTAGISPKNFMAGKMNFDRPPRPGARIVNRGRITMKQAGLAAFVGPIVANHGTITAKLGHVELAGASAFILNASADGHIAINVTKAVRKVDLGGRKVTALVTNDGTIVANGGTVTLTARALDGVVKQLLDVRGAIHADTADGKSGTITINGVGGDLRVAGNLLAQGKGPGDHGGTIAVDSTGTVTVARQARIDASGQAGGGVVAIGTDARRAATGPGDTTAPRAKAVTIEKDAAIHADATRSGNGGTVTLLSSSRTDQGGAISARGAGSGHGGTAEISSDGVISLSGTENVGAPSGHDGTVTLDPATLIVGSGSPSANSTGNTTFGSTGTKTTTSYIAPSAFSGISGTIVLQAASLVSVAASPNISAYLTALTIDSHGDVSVTAPISLAGSLEIDANGIIDIAGSLAADAITLSDLGAKAGGVVINAPVAAGTRLAAAVDSGGLHETNAGVITAASITSDGDTIGGGVTLSNASNAIGTLSNLTTTGSLTVADAGALWIDGTVRAGSASIDAAGGLYESPTSALTVATLTDAASGTGVSLEGTANAVGTFAPFSAPTGSVTIIDSVPLTVEGLTASGVMIGDVAPVTLSGTIPDMPLSGNVDAQSVTINSSDLTIDGDLNVLAATAGQYYFSGLSLGTSVNITEAPTAAIVADFISGPGSVSGSVDLAGTTNSIAQLYGFDTIGGDFDLYDSVPLGIYGRVAASDITIVDPDAVFLTGLQASPAGTVALVAGSLYVGGGDLGPGGIYAPGGVIEIAPPQAGTLIVDGGASQVSSGSAAALVLDGNQLTGWVSATTPPAASLVLGRAVAFGSATTAADVSVTTPLSLAGSLDIEADGMINIAGDLSAGGIAGSAGISINDEGSNAGDILIGAPISTSGTLHISTDALNATQVNGVSIDSALHGNGVTIADLGAAADGVVITDAVHAGPVFATHIDHGGLTELGAGAIDASLFEGSVGGEADLGGANAIATLGDLRVAGAPLLFTDSVPLTIAGNVAAEAATISAWQTLFLDGSAGGELLVDGQPLPKTGVISPRAGTDTVLAVRGDPTLVQTGTFRINAGPVAVADGVANRPVTVFLDLSPAATARFADLQAPSTDVVLMPGSGSVTGKVHLRYLLIQGTAAPQVKLFGTLGDLGGTAAAANGTVRPTLQINYTMNGCVIGAAHCAAVPTLLSLSVPRPFDPLEKFSIVPPRKRKLDPNVQLPDIATKDY